MLEPFRSFTNVTVLAGWVTLSACATVGAEFDSTRVNDIETGKTTKAQVQEWFGMPYSITRNDEPDSNGCVEGWGYVHSRATHAGAKVEAKSLIVAFDKQGIVCDQGYSEKKS